MITAAHCKNPRIRELVLGDHDLSKDPDCEFSACLKAQRFKILPSDFIVHEQYELSKVRTEGHDIALIRLPRLAETYQENVDQLVIPICLGWHRVQIPSNHAVVAGWGRTSNDFSDRGDLAESGAFSNVLQKVEVNLLTDSECLQNFKNLNTQRQMCAGGEGG